MLKEYLDKIEEVKKDMGIKLDQKLAHQTLLQKNEIAMLLNELVTKGIITINKQDQTKEV